MNSCFVCADGSEYKMFMIIRRKAKHILEKCKHFIYGSNDGSNDHVFMDRLSKLIDRKIAFRCCLT